MSETTTNPNIFGQKLVNLDNLTTFWGKIKTYLVDNYDAKNTAAQLIEGLKIDDTYQTKVDAAQALSDAKDYADDLVFDNSEPTRKPKFDAVGAAAQALSDAKDYADGVAATAAAGVLGASDDTAEEVTVYGVKAYANSLSSKIDSIVAGGVSFKGVVNELPPTPNNGDLIIVGKKDGIVVGEKTYKEDYEYVYYKPQGAADGIWYELGDSDKNSKAIATLQTNLENHITAQTNNNTAQGELIEANTIAYNNLLTDLKGITIAEEGDINKIFE